MNRPHKQSMSELKLRRVTEHNARLREDLARPRIRVSEAASRYASSPVSSFSFSNRINISTFCSLIRYCRTTKDHLVCPLTSLAMWESLALTAPPRDLLRSRPSGVQSTGTKIRMAHNDKQVHAGAVLLYKTPHLFYCSIPALYLVSHTLAVKWTKKQIKHLTEDWKDGKRKAIVCCYVLLCFVYVGGYLRIRTTGILELSSMLTSISTPLTVHLYSLCPIYRILPLTTSCIVTHRSCTISSHLTSRPPCLSLRIATHWIFPLLSLSFLFFYLSLVVSFSLPIAWLYIDID